ncbi:MAG: methylamine utilization protein [Ignavibacteriae bacterium]|nr:methylamine utilization protein [Ignavibacteriota bacterium]
MEIAENNFLNNVKKIDYSLTLFNITYYCIVIILLFSGLSKIINPLPLLETLELFSFSEDLNLIVTLLLPIFEIILGLLLLFKIKIKTTLLIVSILFLSFVAFSIYVTVIGTDGDCGCFGNVIKSEFGWGMIIRNIIFFIFSIILYIKQKSLNKLNRKLVTELIK